MSGSSYDEIPYTSYPYERTHPDRLATVAALFGLSPAPPRSARVLELGCASGGNLLPMAAQLPDAELVGVDLSARQIEQGNEAIAAAGLTNATLHATDLTTVDESWGQFDYVICHGVMSWVDRSVQDRILALMGERLAPHGVGIVSYNTYPGWHLRQAVRQMMLFHVEQFADDGQRAEQAKALLQFVAQQGLGDARGGNEAWADLMRREAELVSNLPADYLFHEHLEEHNTPLYFHEFEGRLDGHGLAYVGDADVATMTTGGLPPDAAAQLNDISPDLVRLEQYLDFVRGRQFRSSLVCPRDAPLQRHLSGGLVTERFVSCRGGSTTQVQSVDLSPGVTELFVAGAATMRSDVPVTKAALHHLVTSFPRSVPFDGLLFQARQALRDAGVDPQPGDSDALGADVLRCYLGGGLHIRTEAPRCRFAISDMPLASPYARWQAGQLPYVTNALHVRVELDRAAARIVTLLDGTRDRAALVQALDVAVRDKTFALSCDDTPVTEATQRTQALQTVLDHTLQRLADAAVLQG